MIHVSRKEMKVISDSESESESEPRKEIEVIWEPRKEIEVIWDSDSESYLESYPRKEIEVIWDSDSESYLETYPRKEIEVIWDSDSESYLETEPRKEIEVIWDSDSESYLETYPRKEIEVIWDSDSESYLETYPRKEIEVIWDSEYPESESESYMILEPEPTIDVLYYSSKSRKKSGFTKDDIIKTKYIYNKLLKIPYWRNKLHDSWIETTYPFMIDDLSYASIYHYYHREKFLPYPLFSYQFCLESNSILSININMAISAGSISGYFGKKQIRASTITPTVFSFTEKKQIRRKALYAKFSQIESLRFLLLCTKNCNLIDKTTQNIDYDLMEIRSMI
jgi:hypothetical protein